MDSIKIIRTYKEVSFICQRGVTIKIKNTPTEIEEYIDLLTKDDYLLEFRSKVHEKIKNLNIPASIAITFINGSIPNKVILRRICNIYTVPKEIKDDLIDLMFPKIIRRK